MNRWFGALVIGGVSLSVGLSSPMRAETLASFTSPQGKFTVSFQTPKLRLSEDPEAPAAARAVPCVRYRVAFYPAGQLSTAIAVTNFFDVYGLDPKAKPTPPKALLDQFIWAPEEDYVILPPQKWAADQPESGRRAVSLQPLSSWQFVDFPLDDKPLIWLDDVRVAGNLNQPCQKAVGIFNGKYGKWEKLSEGVSPIGYQILSSSDRQIVMKRLLDDCASDDDKRSFHAECVSLDLSFMRRGVIACPP